MPRVLFIVDEFQELFVEDDKLAQDSGLLLDRLVRQGRAFGIHVLLGSQTLSGAYSLARSTMGQMAVRVALQCSEADAHLILSDERNEAARFLSRPGEAIYNDQNGLLAGNHPFQVVWLPESQRVSYLRQVEAKSNASSAKSGKETIVFEGDQAADPANNLAAARVVEEWTDRCGGRIAKGVDRRGGRNQGADVCELWPACGQQSARRRCVGRIGARRVNERRHCAGGAKYARSDNPKSAIRNRRSSFSMALDRNRPKLARGSGLPMRCRARLKLAGCAIRPASSAK